MFAIFKKKPMIQPQLTDAEIKRRASIAREKMGKQCVTVKGSSFRYTREFPTVLGQRLI